MDLRGHLRLLRRNWMLIVTLPLLCACLALGYSQLQTPLYESTASVYVAAQQASSAADLSQGNIYGQQVVKSFAIFAVKPIVLNRVIDRLGLDTNPTALANQVTASAPINTTILNISVLDPSPGAAARIANAVSSSLVAVIPSVSPDASTGASSIKITPIEGATTPAAPVSPRKTLNVLLGLIAGVALGVGLTYLRGALDVRIRGLEDVETVSAKPVLGGILFDRMTRTRPLIVHADPRSPRAESFRTIRTNLQFLDFGRGARSMVITSSLESEGKSTSAANLAIAVADTGQRVLLIDADLRRPKLHDYLGIDGYVGLTDVLIGRVPVAAAMQRWGNRQMTVLPAGPIPPNPSELLQSAAMMQLLESAKQQFDTVIIDAPPLLPVSDAALLARATAGAIVIAAARKTSRPHLKAALSMLDQVEARTLGIVVTMLPGKGPDRYGYGAYGYRAAYDTPNLSAP